MSIISRESLKLRHKAFHELKKLKYPDASRIAREIADFIAEDSQQNKARKGFAFERRKQQKDLTSRNLLQKKESRASSGVQYPFIDKDSDQSKTLKKTDSNKTNLQQPIKPVAKGENIVPKTKNLSPTPQSLEQLAQIVERLKNHEPWEYIRGWAEFRGLKFKVNPKVLIPRIETEQLVDLALERIQKNKGQIKNILDVGTGSGSIIISIAKSLKSNENHFQYLACDLSEDALKIARQNARQHKVNVTFRKSDLLKNIPLSEISQNTLFIANLPYIPSDKLSSLDKSVKDFEPKIALDGGKFGLKHYKRLLREISKFHLLPDSIYTEIDPMIATEFRKVFPRVRIIKDFQGNDRFGVWTFTTQP